MTTQSDSRFVKRLIQEVERLLQEALDFELLYAEELKQVDPDFVDSARNLLHYLGVRRHDTEGQGREGRVELCCCDGCFHAPVVACRKVQGA